MLESKGEVLKALAALRGAIKSITKETKEGMNYKIVKYDTLVDELRELTLTHGLALVPEKCVQTNCTPYEAVKPGYGGKPDRTIHTNCDSFVFTFKLWHISGEYIDVSMPSIGIDEQDKGPGKASTYAAKNAWEKLLMLRRGDENDVDTKQSQADQRAPAQQQPPAGQPAKQPGPVELTHDRKTWPKQWQDVFQYLYDNAVKPEPIESDDSFSWINNVTKVKEELMAKNPPALILDETLSWYTVALVGAALKTRHKSKTVVSVLKNRDVFVNYVGYEEAMKRFARLEEIRAELGTAAGSEEIPF